MNGILDLRRRQAEITWAGVPLESIELLDRTLLQHAIEQMAANGIQRCVLVTEHPVELRKQYGGGHKWGCTIEYCGVADITSMLSQLEDEPVLIGQAVTIPGLGQAGFELKGRTQPQLYMNATLMKEGLKSAFTGWAVSMPYILLRQCFATEGAAGLLHEVLRDSNAAEVISCATISAASPEALHTSVELVLEGHFTDIVYHASEIRPGILAGEWPSVHADATCNGKAYIGAHVRIARDVKLEGYVSIGSNCVVASGAEIRNSVVLPGTYIGSMARLDGDIAFTGKLIHGDGASIQIDDPRLVASTDIEPSHILSHFRRLLKQSLQHSS